MFGVPQFSETLSKRGPQLFAKLLSITRVIADFGRYIQRAMAFENHYNQCITISNHY